MKPLIAKPTDVQAAIDADLAEITAHMEPMPSRATEEAAMIHRLHLGEILTQEAYTPMGVLSIVDDMKRNFVHQLYKHRFLRVQAHEGPIHDRVTRLSMTLDVAVRVKPKAPAESRLRALVKAINDLTYCPYCGQGHAMHTTDCRIRPLLEQA